MVHNHENVSSVFRDRDLQIEERLRKEREDILNARKNAEALQSLQELYSNTIQNVKSATIADS